MYQEFLKATGLNYGGQAPEKFYSALADAVSKISEEEWNTLSEPAQLWYNDLVAAIQGKTNIPEIPGGLPEVAPGTKVPRAAFVRPAKEKPVKVKKPERDRADTVTWKIKEAVLAKIDVTIDEIDAQLKAMGKHASKATIAVQAGNIRHDLRVLQAHGLLNKHFDLDKPEDPAPVAQAAQSDNQATA